MNHSLKDMVSIRNRITQLELKFFQSLMHSVFHYTNFFALIYNDEALLRNIVG